MSTRDTYCFGRAPVGSVANLGRNGELSTPARGVGLRVLAGAGAEIDTTNANGRLVFGIFAALAEFERELIVERTREFADRMRAVGLAL